MDTSTEPTVEHSPYLEEVTDEQLKKEIKDPLPIVLSGEVITKDQNPKDEGEGEDEGDEKPEEEDLEHLLERPNNIPCEGFHKEIVQRTDDPKHIDMYIYPPAAHAEVTHKATKTNKLRSSKDITRYISGLKKVGLSLPEGCTRKSFGRFYTRISSLSEEDHKLLRAAQIVAAKTAQHQQEIEEEDEDTDTEEETDESDDEHILKKLDQDIQREYLAEFHPEIKQINFDELMALSRVVRDPNGKIIDSLHQTFSFMSKYERARIIGLRAKQINNGAEPFIHVSAEMIDGFTIAKKELEEKKIPYIIRRPLPNGASEYWKVDDLELI